MSKRMLVDATHLEEVRVAIVEGNRLLDFDIETSTKEQIKGNIYLGKVTRVEPSLQAAFVDFNGGRQGFLSLSDIHPKYYPADKDGGDSKPFVPVTAWHPDGDFEEGEPADPAAATPTAEVKPPPPRRRTNVPIQKILTRNQTLLVQVVKEARGTKGASLTTNISLAGRYTVLLPESDDGGGISRKIIDVEERQKLREVLSSFKGASKGSLIIRTAGLGRTKREIERDLAYLERLWKIIQEQSAASSPPALLHEEGDLVMRTIRDIYTSDMEEILIDGAEAYKRGKEFMRLLMPRFVKVVQPYKDKAPIFSKFGVEEQMESMHDRIIPLRSGGYLAVDPCEALVAIDINSGRATRERTIENTAYKTNMEAAEEIARQLRMRDLGGLIVLDFIDMEDKKHNQEVEKRLKEAIKQDRAKIQMGKISQFGLLELSRQRLKPTFNEANRQVCPRCKGLGAIRTVESSALRLFRKIEEEASSGRFTKITYRAPLDVAHYLLNQKRAQLMEMEAENQISILIVGDPSLQTPDYHREGAENENGAHHAPTERREAAPPREPPPPREPSVVLEEEEALPAIPVSVPGAPQPRDPRDRRPPQT
ncbi:MAG: ribonuclease E/G, partial [Magnetococcales bacterium]|nr:ribonuclease E/G [Magnetococcales bacterium]